VVFGATAGESKSVSSLSGGERVWINECLTRAIALYLAATTQRRYETLFCDETDGALDPERKRMFMQTDPDRMSELNLMRTELTKAAELYKPSLASQVSLGIDAAASEAMRTAACGMFLLLPM